MVSIRLSPRERMSVVLVAVYQGTSEAEVLRASTITDVVAEADGILARVKELALAG